MNVVQNSKYMKTKTIILIAALLLSTASSFAQGGTTGPLTWNLNDSTLTISGTGAMPDYNYPNSGYPAPWYPYHTAITTIVIENGVASIGNYAFYECYRLTSIIFPNSVTSIGTWAFYDCCWITSITLPSSVESIGNYAFLKCISLISIDVPNGVTSIGWSAFEECVSLTSFTIPSSVTNIEDGTFAYCSSLASITIPNNVITIGFMAFYYCESLTSITIPNSVANIGEIAFTASWNLTLIEVDSENPNYSSDNGALFNKDKTTLICCPSGKTGSYTIPSTVTTIGSNAFGYCYALTSITIPNSVTIIESAAFSYCTALNSIIVPNSVTNIGVAAFICCWSLTSVILPDGITKIEDNVFEKCYNLASIDIPSGVTSIGEMAFLSCSYLTLMDIPEGVTSIGHATFAGCSDLELVVLPSTITSIGGWKSFGYCTALTLIINLNPTPIAIDPDVFDEVNISACTLKVPASSVSAYKNADVWKEFNVVGIDVGIEPIETDVVKIYPNPTKGELTVETDNYPSVQNVEIFDVMGRKVQGLTFNVQSSDFLNFKPEKFLSFGGAGVVINISNLPSGIYFVRITTENSKMITKKIMKQ
jgi:hypothetical protein